MSGEYKLLLKLFVASMVEMQSPIDTKVEVEVEVFNVNVRKQSASGNNCAMHSALNLEPFLTNFEEVKSNPGQSNDHWFTLEEVEAQRALLAAEIREQSPYLLKEPVAPVAQKPVLKPSLRPSAAEIVDLSTPPSDDGASGAKRRKTSKKRKEFRVGDLVCAGRSKWPAKVTATRELAGVWKYTVRFFGEGEEGVYDSRNLTGYTRELEEMNDLSRSFDEACKLLEKEDDKLKMDDAGDADVGDGDRSDGSNYEPEDYVSDEMEVDESDGCTDVSVEDFQVKPKPKPKPKPKQPSTNIREDALSKPQTKGFHINHSEVISDPLGKLELV